MKSVIIEPSLENPNKFTNRLINNIINRSVLICSTISMVGQVFIPIIGICIQVPHQCPAAVIINNNR